MIKLCPNCAARNSITDIVEHGRKQYKCVICDYQWGEEDLCDSPTRCEVCGGEMENGRCLSCRGYTCVACGFPVYRDESFVFTARGKFHARCRCGAKPRPDGMP